MNGRELEVNLLVRDLTGIEKKLDSLGAELEQPRTHEINLRFDTARGELSRSATALRLRKDTAARLTYKGPSKEQDGVRVREEIEFVVDDFHAARAFLEALGFGIKLIYEKYRTVYLFKGVHVTLDELPYGNFIEIEGPEPNVIHDVCGELQLNWEKKIPDSYVMLFNRLQRVEGYGKRDLIFENYSNADIAEKILSLQPADVKG
jgi:adenylate cyclase class 2